MPMSGVFGCPKTTDKLTNEYLPQISREMILTRSLNEIRDSLHHLDLFRTFLLVSHFSPLDDFTHHETSRNHPWLQKKLPPPKTNEYTLKIAGWKMRGCPFKTVPVQEDNSFVLEQPASVAYPKSAATCAAKVFMSEHPSRAFLATDKMPARIAWRSFFLDKWDKKWDVPQITSVGPRNGKSPIVGTKWVIIPKYHGYT